jgi:hypothetical protein
LPPVVSSPIFTGVPVALCATPSNDTGLADPLELVVVDDVSLPDFELLLPHAVPPTMSVTASVAMSPPRHLLETDIACVLPPDREFPGFQKASVGCQLMRGPKGWQGHSA